jgi:peptide/nickel transport system permease protein
MRISEIFQVLPTFILAAVIVALSGPGLPQVIVVIAILAWPQTARVMRGEVMRIKQLDFVAALHCLGIGETEILLREIIPNALAPVLAVGTLIVGQAILLEASLGYLGLSSPEIVSWGRMLNDGQRFLFNAWWLSLFPGAAIFLTVLAFNLGGDAVSAALDPRQSGSGRR